MRAVKEVHSFDRKVGRRAAPGVIGKALCAMGGVGVVAATWAFFFPPARPREVTENQGDTPSYGGQALNPDKGASPLCTPPCSEG